MSAIAFFMFERVFAFIEKIFVTTSNFLAFIQTGFFIHSSKSTTKLSGITFKISLFCISTQVVAFSSALSISSSVTSLPEIEIIHLLFMTSKPEILKEMNAQFTCSQAIFSASSKEESKLFLNSSMSKIFPFLIAFEFAIHIHKMWKSLLFSLSKYPIIVLILELHISIVVTVLEADIFN